MSDTDDAAHARAADPRGPRGRLAHIAVGAAEGAVIAFGALCLARATLLVPASAVPVAFAAGIALGALLGAAVGGARARRARRAPEMRVERVALDPDAWLQVVSGISRRALEGALVEIAAPLLARGGRVLIVDGGRHLRLHERMGGSSRRGLVEWLAGSSPLLGLVQSGGRRGLHLLAHGAPGVEERWPRLGQLLDEARPHFSRLVLVIDPTAHHAIGDALRGRLLQGWWAGDPGGLPQVAVSLSERLGIPLHRFELGESVEVMLEAIDERTAALRGLLPVAPREAGAPPAIATPSPAVPRVEILDCDLQVRERLRFLIWMRRLQAESRREVLAPALRG